MATAIVQKEKQGVAVKSTTPESLLDSMFKAFETISRRAFEIFESNGRSHGHDLEDWFKAKKNCFIPFISE